MKNMIKKMVAIGTAASALGCMYLLSDKKTMKKACKKVISAMDSAEDMIAKKIN